MTYRLIGHKDPALHTVCEAVPHGDDVSELVAALERLCLDHGGAGLAAPQLGVTRRVIFVNYAATRLALINPRIVEAPGKRVTSLNEGCLSFPGKRVDVKRSKRVVVEGFDADWNPVRIDARNFLAFVFQHEIDHLNGVTIA